MENYEVKISSEKSPPLIDIPLSSAAGACKICLLSQAKYTCPRCHLAYCSVACYQSEKHVGCSEAFYKDWVVNELKDMTNNPEDKKKVMEMLTKDLEEKANEESDDDSDDDLAVRLNGLDLDQDIGTIWKRLTKKEKEEFAKMFQDGRLAELIELWTPWWRSKKNNVLVMEEKESDLKAEDKMPNILTDIADINTLLKNKRPSANIKFDLLNILFSYAYVSRIHNGSHLECAVESCQELLSTCVVLHDQSSCSSVGEAIQKSLESLYSKEKVKQSSTFEFHMTLLEDVQLLISGPAKSNSMTFMMAALSDLTQLLRTARSIIKKEQNHSDDLKSLKSQVFKAEKKTLFVMSWLQRYGMGMQKFLPLLQFEIETRQCEHDTVSEIKSAVETNMDALKANISQSSSEDPKIVELT